MTLSKIAKRKKFSRQDEVKLSRKTVMTFYTFTKFAVKSDALMQIFFNAFSVSLRKEI
jgi:farnesyl-diphosphate farnesyltransferase